MTILLLPGLNNSGPDHWQSLWEQQLPGAIRVEQQEWDQPQRDDWIAGLAATIAASEGPVVIAAHSLGCALTAWWAAAGMPGLSEADKQQGKLRGALLVAPPDVNRPEFPAPSFAPMPAQQALPFTSKVIASSDDPWCDVAIARNWAQIWNAEFHDIGAVGHINAASGLHGWKQGQAWLSELLSS